MAGELGAVQVRNLARVKRALSQTEKGMRREIDAELKTIGEPIRSEAESLSLAGIRNIGPEWSRMKVGLSVHTVFVVPTKRSTKQAPLKRPNLGRRLLEEALEPALAHNHGRIADDVDAALGRVVSRFGSHR